MDMQLVIVALCIAGAAFFIIRRMLRAMRKGQCGCSCDNACSNAGRPREASCCTEKSAAEHEAQRLESARIDAGPKPEDRT